METLYKRNKNGSIQYWKVSVQNDIVRKESGQLGTLNPIIHNEQVFGKNISRSNETTPAQQAELEAESDWKKKHDDGYKSLKDLGIPYDKDEKPHPDYLPLALNAKLPQFNTDAQGNIKPMLAKDWKKVKNITYPCIVEPKLDGVRCLMLVFADTGNVVFLSRSGKEYTTLSHIKSAFTLDVLTTIGEDVILDGEVYSDELTFQEIIAAVKKQSPNSPKLHLRVYDIVNDKPQLGRRREMEEIVDTIDSEFVVPITWTVAHDAAEVKQAHDSFVQAGNEGAMLRINTGKYEQGCRSSCLLKVKEFDETEFTVEALEHGQRGVEDLIAVCVSHKASKDDPFFRAKIEGSKEQKIKFEEEYQGAYETEKDIKLTVKHFGWTTDMLPRFPIGKALRLYE